MNDPSEVCRAAALSALAEYFSEDPATKALLRVRAIEDTDGRCRADILTALARHFRGDLVTKALLQARAIEDTDRHCRGIALLRLAEMLNSNELERLASRDLDALPPGRDPREPITFEDIARAAAKLETTEDNIRRLFGALAKEVPLIFA